MDNEFAGSLTSYEMENILLEDILSDDNMKSSSVALVACGAIDATKNALRKLPIEQAEVLMLRYAQGFSYKEIGEAIGLTDDVAKQQLAKASANCRVMLKKCGVLCVDNKKFGELLLERVLSEYDKPAQTSVRFSKNFSRAIEGKLRPAASSTASSVDQTCQRDIKISISKLAVVVALAVFLGSLTVAAVSMVHSRLTMVPSSKTGVVAPVIETTPGEILSEGTQEKRGLPYVPDGFTLKDRIETNAQYIESYLNKNGAVLYFHWSALEYASSVDEWVRVDCDGEILQFLVGDLVVNYVEQNRCYVYLWNDDVNVYLLQVSRTLSESEALKILEEAILSFK